MKLDDNPYLATILSQPETLQSMLARLDLDVLRPYIQALKNGAYDRLILTGMGASGYAAYPAWLRLVRAGLPAYQIDCAELVHHANALITRRSLIWVISQSGRSAEIIHLLDLLRASKAGGLIATVNDLNSPLAQAAGVALPIDAAIEETVSTRTYLNSLAITQLAAEALCGGELNAHLDSLLRTAASLTGYLSEWEEHLSRFEHTLGMPERLVIVGRGSSMAAVQAGALIISEAAKFLTLGLNAAQFRHGPMEMASGKLTVLVLAGPPETADLNQRLVQDLLKLNAHAYYLSPMEQDSLPALPMPYASAIGLPLAEMVPLQLLSVSLAVQNGFVPGKFFYSGKVTLSE